MPNIVASLQLAFARTKRLDPRITFSRASTGTYFNASGVLTSAASGEPRFDHDPATGESLGLLIEEQRTNLLTYSEQFDNAAWVRNGVLAFGSGSTANAIAAPDGTMTADLITESALNENHRMILTTALVVTNGATYTVSCFAKAGTRTWFRMWGTDVASYVNFNLSDGTVGLTTASAGNYGITPVGNGWYRCWVTTTASSGTSGYAHLQMMASNVTNNIYTGDGTSGLYIWGAQLEAGAFPTSYIPTVAAAVTRNADVASMTGTNFSSWYRQDEGTFVVTTRTKSVATSATMLVAHFDAANRITMEYTTNERVILWSRLASVASSFTSSNGTAPRDGTSKTCVLAVKANDGAGVLTSVAPSSLSPQPTALPSLNQLSIGHYQVGTTNFLNGHISRLTYFPVRLSNTTLQALSS